MIVKKLTPGDLNKRVKFFFGSELLAGECIERIYDEHLHHRGQLCVYLRLLGVKPPYLYGS